MGCTCQQKTLMDCTPCKPWWTVQLSCRKTVQKKYWVYFSKNISDYIGLKFAFNFHNFLSVYYFFKSETVQISSASGPQYYSLEWWSGWKYEYRKTEKNEIWICLRRDHFKAEIQNLHGANYPANARYRKLFLRPYQGGEKLIQPDFASKKRACQFFTNNRPEKLLKNTVPKF